MAYALHALKPADGSRRNKKRVGRGNASGHGTFSTRGSKGQRARSGGRSGLKKKGMHRIIAAMPKMKGFRSLQTKPATVSLTVLSATFPDGALVNLGKLKRMGLVHARSRSAKILAGVTTRKLTLSHLEVSAPAKHAIEAAGGTVEAQRKVPKAKRKMPAAR